MSANREFTSAESCLACNCPKRRLRLIQFLVDFRRIDFRQQISRLHLITNVHQPTFQITACARINGRLFQRLYVARQQRRANPWRLSRMIHRYSQQGIFSLCHFFGQRRVLPHPRFPAQQNNPANVPAPKINNSNAQPNRVRGVGGGAPISSSSLRAGFSAIPFDLCVAVHCMPVDCAGKHLRLVSRAGHNRHALQ